MSTKNTQSASSSTLKAYEAKVTAQLHEAKAKLDQFQAKAGEKGAQAEAATINGLKATKQNIERKLQDLKATNDVYVTRAKADIDADVTTFKASIDELAGKVRKRSTNQ